MLDHVTLIRKAIITALKRDPAVAEIVGERVYDEADASPEWPFIRIDPPAKTKYESSCGDGFDMEWPIHLFVRGPGTGPVNDLESKVFTVLEDADLPIVGLIRFNLDFLRSNTRPDQEDKSGYHTDMKFSSTSVE